MITGTSTSAVRIRVLTLLSLVVATGAFAQAQPSSSDILALRAKPAVVRIIDGFQATFDGPDGPVVVTDAGTGSGFFLSPEGYVATNAHVVERTHDFDQDKASGVEGLYVRLCAQLKRPCGDDDDDDEIIKGLVKKLYRLRPDSIVHAHWVRIPDGSQFDFEIKAYGRPTGQGKDVAILKIEVRDAPTIKMGNSQNIALRAPITIFGYPGVADVRELLDERSQFEVSISDGRVSARKSLADAAPVLQLNAAAAPGNSGGPVLDENGLVVGLLTFAEESGFVFAVPSDTVNEFVRQAGATNQSGIVDTRYEEGLTLFQNKHYSAAKAKFEEVRNLFPQHSEAGRLITQCQGFISSGHDVPVTLEGGRKDPPLRWWLPVAGLGLLGLAAWMVWRSKTPRSVPTAAPAQRTAAPPTPAAHRSAPQSAPAAHRSSPDEDDATVLVGAGPTRLGSIACVSGPLAGQRFDLRPEGLYIGRDEALSQIVIRDSRVSKRHVWVGPRNGKVVAVDQASSNGTFLNHAGSEKIREVVLQSGDTIIVSEPEVGQFIYKR